MRVRDRIGSDRARPEGTMPNRKLVLKLVWPFHQAVSGGAISRFS